MKDEKPDVVESVEDLLPTPFESKPTSFTEVTRAIHGEREYQKQRWEGTAGMPADPDDRQIEEYLEYMSEYMKTANVALEDDDDPERALHMIRKVTALGYACMETHGAPKREGF